MTDSKKILYVEDEIFLGKIVKESLQDRGYEVRMVQDGGLVIAALNEFSPDVIVLDIMLPTIDGYSLAEEIKLTLPDTPIIFVSAKGQSQDVVKGFSVGGDDYMRKPFSLDELEARISNLLSRPAPTSKDVKSYTLGKYTYHPRQQKLVHANGETSLSHRTSEVLSYLYENRQEIIQRKELLLQLWGDDSYFNSRNLDVYVKKIRDYLADEPTIKILTLKGVGYRFLIDD